MWALAREGFAGPSLKRRRRPPGLSMQSVGRVGRFTRRSCCWIRLVARAGPGWRPRGSCHPDDEFPASGSWPTSWPAGWSSPNCCGSRCWARAGKRGSCEGRHDVLGVVPVELVEEGLRRHFSGGLRVGVDQWRARCVRRPWLGWRRPVRSDVEVPLKLVQVSSSNWGSRRRGCRRCTVDRRSAGGGVADLVA